MKPLIAINQITHKKVYIPHPVNVPEGKKEFIYNGLGFRGRPPHLAEYLRGGWRYSEQRKKEIWNSLKLNQAVNASIRMQEYHRRIQNLCTAIFERT